MYLHLHLHLTFSKVFAFAFKYISMYLTPCLDWAHLASQASSHQYQSTYKIWKQSDKGFLSYRENDEVSADAAADA